MKKKIRVALLVLTALLLCFATACSAVEQLPTDPPFILPEKTKEPVHPSSLATFEPSSDSSSAKEKTIIEIPSYGNASEFKDTLLRLNNMLSNAGQGVEIKILANQRMSLYDTVQNELAANNFSAAAYALKIEESADLFNHNITMDLTDLVKSNAPYYTSKYVQMFPEKLQGIPVAINGNPRPHKLTLMLRTDFDQVGGTIRSIDDLLRFVDDVIVTAGKDYQIFAEPYMLVDEWALEQGYYPITNGYLYATAGNAKNAPVALEDIPGFRSFLSQLFKNYRGKALSGSSVGKSIIGFVNYLDAYYKPAYYSLQDWAPWIKGQFKARVFAPDQPALAYSTLYGAQLSVPAYDMELAVPAVSPKEKAVNVIRFVEWLYSNQDNYDMVLYGEKGVDFVAAEGRFTPMINGQIADIKKEDPTSSIYFMAWPGSGVLCNSEFYRIPSCAPAGVEEAMQACETVNRNSPDDTFICKKIIDEIQSKRLISSDIEGIGTKRHRLYMDFIYAGANVLAQRSDDDIDRLLNGLAALDNTKYVNSYTAAIDDYIKKNTITRNQ